MEDNLHGAAKASTRSKFLLANLRWQSTVGFSLLILMSLKHEFYDKPTLIAGVQSVTLYTILHIEEVESIPKQYLKSIITTLGVCSSLQFIMNSY